ncbi:MAG: imidazole glycerol phosphate synthase subunit HisH [Candidatus Omnitrophica bacterium]|nr:imidazole glycerol phosphate synthase subunit HisH [Candidatus Omnitrophota bacterium]
MIAIIDYHMGNLRSVAKAIEHIGGEAVITNDHDTITAADKIILPGVGGFPQGVKNLEKLSLINLIKDQILSEKKPFLGICLGMQLLAKKSYEFEETEGLSIIDAEICELPRPDETIKIPHVGWDDIDIKKKDVVFFNRISSGDTFYFVHSFYMKNSKPEDVVATCDYGIEFTCAVKKDNVFATQFHPEKSQEHGLDILYEFLIWEGQN